LSASVASCSQINLFWNASTDIGSGIRGYNLYGWRNATWTFLKQVLSPATSTFNGGLSGSTLYYYSVASVDNAGHTSGLSAFVSATTSACGTATTTTTIRATTTTTLANRAPVANGGSNVTGAVGLPVSLNDAASYDPDAGDWIASYKWTFGDGTPSVTYTTAGTVTHTYTAAGTYNAVLTVTDSHGAMSSVTVVASVGALSGAKGQFMWNRHVLASSGLDSSGFLGVARDSAGNVVAVGSGGRNINWGSGVSGGELSDALIIKYSATGSLVWAKRLPSNNDSMNAVAIDASDNIVVTGGFQDSIDFGAGPLTSVGSSDFFLAKYSSSGALLWARQFGGLMVETGRGVVVDQTGNIFVVGFFSGTTSFGGGSLTAPSGGGVFLAKYSPTGAHLWSKSFSGGSQQPGAIAIDGNGNIAVVGNFSGTVNFGGGSLTSAGGTDVFVAEYSSSGAHLWSRRGGGSGADLGYGIAVGPTGNVVAVGVFMGTANFGGSSFMSGGGTNDIFVAQYSSTGAHMWSESFGGELAYGSDTAKAVTVDGSGNVILTGNIQGPVDFGGGPLYGNNTGDIFVAKLNSNGDYLWAKRAGGDTDYDNGNAVVTDASGNVIVAGAFTLSCNFGGGLLTSPWGDATVVEFTP
jgi:PKD repeat protein